MTVVEKISEDHLVAVKPFLCLLIRRRHRDWGRSQISESVGHQCRLHHLMHCPKFYISAEITGTITDSSNWEPVGCEVFAVINIESIIIHITTITITISQSSDLVQLRESSKGGETGWWKLPSSSFPASLPIIPQVHFTHHYKRTEHHISSSLKTNV